MSAPGASFVLGAQSIASAATLNAILLVALIASIPIHGANTAYIGIAVLGTAITGALALAIVALLHGSRRANRWIRVAARKLPFIDDAAEAAS